MQGRKRANPVGVDTASSMELGPELARVARLRRQARREPEMQRSARAAAEEMDALAKEMATKERQRGIARLDTLEIIRGIRRGEREA